MNADRMLDGRALCVVGPGGDYQREIADSGTGLLSLRSRPVDESTVIALARMLADRRRAARVIADDRLTDLAAEERSDVSIARNRALPPVLFGSLSAYLAEEWSDASIEGLPQRSVADAEAVACADVHPGLHERARVLSHHAGTRRRVRGQQGNRLRAHFGAAKKGLPEAFAPQGT